jgi:hypothetical protein
MNKKKIITKISEGLGNQLFMYAHAYALSKNNDLELFVDPYSGYFRDKNAYSYYLDRFELSSKIANSNYIFDNQIKNLYKKVLIFFENFKTEKSFIFEKKGTNKSTYYSPINLNLTSNTFFLDGNFESEKYFLDFRDDLLNEFKIKDENSYKHNKYLDFIKKENVISICVRQNKFSERIRNKYDKKSILKSINFVEETIKYIYNAVAFFEKKITNPKFLVWSNDFSGLERYFNKDKFIFVKNEDDKILSDFYLLTQCKFFIVAPTSFHWWGAWLSNHKKKNLFTT